MGRGFARARGPAVAPACRWPWWDVAPQGYNAAGPGPRVDHDADMAHVRVVPREATSRVTASRIALQPGTVWQKIRPNRSENALQPDCIDHYPL
jgi:hypothetical protein